MMFRSGAATYGSHVATTRVDVRTVLPNGKLAKRRKISVKRLLSALLDKVQRSLHVFDSTITSARDSLEVRRLLDALVHQVETRIFCLGAAVAINGIQRSCQRHSVTSCDPRTTVRPECLDKSAMGRALVVQFARQELRVIKSGGELPKKRPLGRFEGQRRLEPLELAVRLRGQVVQL